MKIWGLTQSEIQQAMPEGLRFEWSGRSGRAVTGRIVPSRDGNVSETPYCRRSASGRWLRASCFHGFADGISFLFLCGATRVQSTGGDWRNASEFQLDWPKLGNQNIGSQANPVRMIDTCNCKERAAK